MKIIDTTLGFLCDHCDSPDFELLAETIWASKQVSKQLSKSNTCKNCGMFYGSCRDIPLGLIHITGDGKKFVPPAKYCHEHTNIKTNRVSVKDYTLIHDLQNARKN